MNFRACFWSSRVLRRLCMESRWIEPESQVRSKNVGFARIETRPIRASGSGQPRAVIWAFSQMVYSQKGPLMAFPLKVGVSGTLIQFGSTKATDHVSTANDADFNSALQTPDHFVERRLDL